MSPVSPQQQTIELFAGIGIVLVVASVIGYVLKASVAHGEPHGGIDNLNARIKAWWVMVAVACGAFLLDRAGVTLLFAFASAVALREFMTLACPHAGAHRWVAASFFAVLPLQYLFVYLGWYAAYTIFVPLYALLALPLVAAASGDTRDFLERAAKALWGLMMCVYCVSHAPALLTLDIPGYEGRDMLLIVFFVVVVQASDVLQYVWGKLIGRRRLAPRVSPSKTWEGAIGGVASATALGAGLFWITPFAPWQAASMALVITTMGFCGGLVMSAIKRDCGAKDWGRLIEGHGGMLDRLDSVVFAAPVFFHLVRYGWT